MAHEISGLEWARAAERPQGLGFGRPRGSKAAGLRYEREVARQLPKAKAGLWWEYRDRHGTRYCQTDLLLEGRDGVLVLECKYTWTRDAWPQLERLYVPVLQMALAKPAWGVQVCKVLRPESQQESQITTNLRQALAWAQQGRRVALHWPGNGVLETRERA